MNLDHRRRVMLAALLFVAALAAFAWVASGLEPGAPLASVDAWSGRWLHRQASPWLTEAMIGISFIGAPSTLTAVAALPCLILLRRRSYRVAAELFTLVLGGNLLNVGLKHLFHRGRPVLDDSVAALTSYSFPSGHAMASTVFYGVVLPCLLLDRRRRRAAVIAGIAVIALVGLSRVYLGVHYASDVIGGILEALAWSTLILTLWLLASDHRRETASR